MKSVAKAQKAIDAVPMDTIRRKVAMGEMHIAHARETFKAPNDDDWTIVSDMLADLMHVCRKKRRNFANLVAEAQRQFAAELEEVEP